MKGNSWKIEIYDSSKLLCKTDLPGNLSRREAVRTTKQLLSQHLTVEDIVKSNFRRNMLDRHSSLDESNTSQGFSVGNDPHAIARYE